MKKTIPFPEEPPPDPNDLPQRDIDLLQNLGIHIDYLDALAQGQPFGAEVIELTNHRLKGK